MNPIPKKYPYWSIYYDDDGYSITGDKIMGRQAAGWSYLRALVKYTDHLSVYLKYSEHKDMLINRINPLLKENNKKLDLSTISYITPNLSEEYGGIFFPGPGIAELSKQRSYHGDDRYSLVGITHTTASIRVMNAISSLPFSHVMPWDAIICTSDCVLDTVNKIIDHRIDNLSNKFSIGKPVLPQLPVIPLGLDKDDFNYSEEFKKQSRADLGINKSDIVLVYVGRLSFHAKAHHLPMYLALEKCSKDLSKDQNIHIIQTGWFANDFVKESFIKEGKEICPSVKFHFLDGKNQDNKHKTLSAGDIFISLSDNIQETFGLTPLEGMASGLPVLVSDWNGYRSTVRDNIDGFRVKTYSLGEGLGTDIAYRHMMDFINYDNYIGMSVQRVAIDISDCIKKLSILIKDKDKRLKFGNEGKRRVKEVFDWPIILKQYRELSDELDQIRITESKNFKEFCSPSLPSDNLDPFYIFSSYPSAVLNKNDIFYRTHDINTVPIKKLLDYDSVNYASYYIPKEEDLILVYSSFKKDNGLSLDKILNMTNLDDNIASKALIWLLKYGYISSLGE